MARTWGTKDVNPEFDMRSTGVATAVLGMMYDCRELEFEVYSIPTREKTLVKFDPQPRRTKFRGCARVVKAGRRSLKIQRMQLSILWDRLIECQLNDQGLYF